MNELVRRIAITIGALLIFRLGSHIPVAGISTEGVELPSGTLARLSIFALSLIPYISAAILILLLSLIPEILVAGGVALPYKIGGGSALIVVCTILDIRKQVRDVSLTNPGGVRQ